VNEVWFDQKMMTRLIDPTYGNLIIMQRLHEDDLVGHILKKYPGTYEHLCLQAEYDPSAGPLGANRLFKDPRAKGEPLFPSLYGPAKLRLLKIALGSFGVASQLQQAPRPKGGLFFHSEWFGRYEIGEVVPEDFVECIQSWDCAVKDKPENDRVAGQVWARIRSDHPKYPNRYCLWDAVSARADFVDNLKMIKLLSEKHPYTTMKLIEDKANGSPIISTLKKQLHDDSVVPFDPKSRSKEIRASAIGPACESGMVIIPTAGSTQWIDEWVNEITGFNKAQHDDQVDAFTQAILHFTQTNEWVFSF
jgi:predicted phage terminase large subunit-like protein